MIRELQNLTEKQDKEFDKVFPCIQEGCGNDGIIPERDEEGDWQPAQCEYCYKVRFPVKTFIAKVRKESIEYERERILKIVENTRRKHNSISGRRACLDILKEL